MSVKDSLHIPKNFPGQVDLVRSLSMGVPKGFDIDLSIAQNDFRYDIAGNIFYLLSAPDDTSYLDIKINENREKAFRLYRGMGFITPFEKLYITTPAGQMGTITMVYGTEAPELLRIIDNRSSTSLGINQVVAELVGDTTPENWGEVTVNAAAVQLLAANANRKACSICADINNTGDVYLGFDNTVTTAAGGANWFHVLTPGASWAVDDYRGDIYGIGTAAGQLVGTGEW